MDDSFPTLFASVDAVEVDVVEQVLNDFFDAWKRGSPIPLTQFFARIQNESPQVRESMQLLLILHDQTLRWQMWSRQRTLMRDTDASPDAPTEPSGRAPLLEDYVRHCSLDGGLESLPPEMIAREFQLRMECGDFPTLENYLERFPHLSPSLSTLLMSSPPETNPRLTVTKDDAPTEIIPSLTHVESPGGALESTQPMSPEKLSKRRRVDTDHNANFGQYELLNEIARGAMGVVYRARHVTIDKIVALKMILEGQLASERQVDQFLLEAQNAGQLEHDNIVRIYDAGKINDQYYIAMAYIEGHSLADAVREKSMSAQRAAEIVEAVARALHFAHTQPQPVYHRDIKPANILLDRSGRPHVTDFGIAKRVEREDTTESGDDDIAGTPSYMPPEQTYGRDIGPWSDVYSTGALLYHLLTGKPPFLADSLLETIRQVRGTEPVAPRDLNPNVDPDLEAVCLKCLEKDRTKRYLSAEHLAEDLRRFRHHEPTQARPISQFACFTKWCHRNPVISKMAAAIALLLATVAVAAVFVAREQANLATIAKVNEQLAKDNEQKEIEQRKIANEKKLEAEAEKKKAVIQQGIAETQKKEADVQRSIADEKKLEAEAKKKEADDQRAIAVKEKKEADDQRKVAQAARQRAEQSLQNAIETVNVILTRSAESGVKDMPGMEDFRKRIAQDALVQLKPIIEANSGAKEAFEAWAQLLVVQAKLLSLTGESEKAGAVFENAVREYRRLTTDSKAGEKHVLDLVAAHRQWGESLADRAKVDHSSSERSLASETQQLLNQAIEQFDAALAIQVGQSSSEKMDCRLETEIARLHQSRSIALIYLKSSDKGIAPLDKAISGLREAIQRLPAGADHRDAERQLGSCVLTLAMAEALERSQPSEQTLAKRLERLKDAKLIHERLLKYDPKSAELRFDLAMTQYSLARVLSDSKNYALAWDEVVEAQSVFSKLAAKNQLTPIYEYRRIGALQLQAAILVMQQKYAAATGKYKEADEGIRAYNKNEDFKEARQENLRLRICLSALELHIDTISNSETSTKTATISWLPETFQDLRRATDPSVVSEASALASVAEHLSAGALAEQKKDLKTWMTAMQSAESGLREYGRLNPDRRVLSEFLRLKVCNGAYVVSSKGGDSTMRSSIEVWLIMELEELKNSTDVDVAGNAVEFLKHLRKSK